MRHPGGFPAGLAPALVAGLALVAAPEPGRAITLEQCLALARKHAPSLQVADAEIRRAQGAVREAQAVRAPTLSLGASYEQLNEAPQQVLDVPGLAAPLGHQVIKLGSANTVDVRTEARYTLYSGGRDPALVRAARAGQGALESARRQTDADLVLRVSRAYYGELAAARLTAAAEEALAAAREHLGVARARVTSGVAPRLDGLRAEVDASERDIDAVRAREARRLARADLEAAVGAALDPADTLAEPALPGAPGAAEPDSQQALGQALAARPELAQLDQQLAEARERVAAARAARRPQVSLSGIAEYRAPNRNGDYGNFSDPGLKTYSLSARAAVSLPLLDGGLTSARVAEQDAERLALEARRADLRLAVEREVRQALSDWRVAAAERGATDARTRWAREALHLAEIAYREGTGPATDVRDAESALATAEADAARALMDYWSAQAELDHATGSTATGEGR